MVLESYVSLESSPDEILPPSERLPCYTVCAIDFSINCSQTNIFKVQQASGHFVISETQRYNDTSPSDDFGTFKGKVREVVHTLEEADTRAYALALQKTREPDFQRYGILRNKVQIGPGKKLPWGGKAD